MSHFSSAWSFPFRPACQSPYLEAGRPRVRRMRSSWLGVALTGLLLAPLACTPEGPKEPGGAAPAPTPVEAEDCDHLERMVVRTQRGYVPIRSPELAPIPTEPNYIGKASDPVHTGPWDYLAEVPLIFYGPGVVSARGRVDTPVTLADAAPMTAELIGHESFRAPDGKSDPGLAAGERPRLVVTIVWDGAGWNTLREHPTSWPTLKSLMGDGSAYMRATIGSTPSNTPPIHTTLGTGAFPRTHGIPHVKMRTESGDYVDPFEGDDASEVRVPSLADVYDPTTENAAQVGVVATVNWHLGMIGHGAAAPDGDRDLAVLLNDQGLTYGNSELYEIPPIGDTGALEAATEGLDAADGEADGRWKGDDLTDSALRYATPAFVDYQQQILERVIAEHGFGSDDVPDLLYVNFKQIDDAGHRWGLRSPQVAANLEASDRALGRLVAFLDKEVGRQRWTIAVTADHGQTLYPEESGGWPIAGGELASDIEREFADDGIEVFRVISSGIFLADPESLKNGTAQRVGEWVANYTAGENLAEGKEMPDGWEGREDERLFSAVLAGREVVSSVCDEN